MKSGIQGLIINQDADGFLSSCGQENCTVDDIKNFAYMFKDSSVTDYMICLNNTNASYPSKVWTSILDKYYQKTEAGKPVDYSGIGMMRGAHHVYETLGVDYTSIWIDCFREIGINPWISIRMNDAHDHMKDVSFLLSDFFHEHPEAYRIKHHNNLEYFDRLFDYSFDIVRDYYKSLIKESLERYDPYGIELDYMREIYLFSIGGEYDGIEILNGFMREVKDIVKGFEEKRGHKIKIAVRIAPDIQTNMNFGLDVMTWAQEGLIDQITPSSRWASTYIDIPVMTWKRILKPYNITFAPCIECNIISSTGGKMCSHTLENYYGEAAILLSQGADKVYVYNCYRGIGEQIKDKDKYETDEDGLIYPQTNYWNLILNLGSYERLQKKKRRCILTASDTYQVWERTAAQLPKFCNVKGRKYLRIPVGDVPKGAAVVLKFGASSRKLEESLPSVFVNSRECGFIGTEECRGDYTKNLLYCYEVPAEALSEFLVVEIQAASRAFMIDYLEAYITPFAQ